MATGPIRDRDGMLDFMPCSREAGLRLKDEIRAMRKQREDCHRRAFEPGYDNLMSLKYNTENRSE